MKYLCIGVYLDEDGDPLVISAIHNRKDHEFPRVPGRRLAQMYQEEIPERLATAIDRILDTAQQGGQNGAKALTILLSCCHGLGSGRVRSRHG